MKEPTSSEETLLNVTPAAGSCRLSCWVVMSDAGCALRPVNMSQTPMVLVLSEEYEGAEVDAGAGEMEVVVEWSRR